MSQSLWRKEFHEVRTKTWVGLVISTITGGSLPLLFGRLKGIVGGVTLPEWIQTDLARQMANYELYLWANWYGKNLLQYVILMAIILAASVVAGEVGRGSAEFLFSLPVSRRVILLHKFLAGVVSLVLIAVVSTALTLAVSWFSGYPVSVGWFARGLPSLLAGGFMIYGMTAVVSAFSSDSLKAGTLSFLLVMLLWFPGFIGASRFSPISYMAGARVWRLGAVDLLWTSVFIILGALSLYWTIRLVEARDF